jgi:hypothetical protein
VGCRRPSRLCDLRDAGVTVTHGDWQAAIGERTAEFRRHFDAEGWMAEWSMAVVLKTGRIGYDVAVIFCRFVPRQDLQYLATIPAS